jgi:AcrR family transcriptional regulator
MIDAVSKIILRDGFKGIGINAIAKEASLDKVLIYRYFDGLNGLLREFAKQKDFYINVSNFIQDEIENAQKNELRNLVTKVLKEQLRGLKDNKELQELMLWEMVEKNELTDAIAKEREEKGYELSSKLKEKMDLKDNESDAVIALLVSGIYYLVLRSRTVDVFNGICLNSEKGWQQIENAIQMIVNTYFDSIKN